MNLPERIGLALLRRREFLRARAELETYSERELNADLRLSRSDIPDLAAATADERVAAFVRGRPAHRRARGGDVLARMARAAAQALTVYGAGTWTLAARGPASRGVAGPRR